MKPSRKAPPQPLAYPWPERRTSAYAAAVLGAVALAVYGPHALELGFYLDDWFVFEKLLDGAGWWERVRALAGTTSRPLSTLVLPTIFQFAGFKPFAYQALLILQNWALACVYFVAVRRWLGSDRAALTAAVLGLLYPVCPAVHHWISAMSQQEALLLTFASLLAHLEWMEHRRPRALALAAALYFASLMLYEAGAFLPAMQAAALWPRLRMRGLSREEAARVLAKDALLPYAAVFIAAALLQRAGIPWLIGTRYLKTIDASAGWFLATYAAALDTLGPGTWRLIARIGPLWRDVFSGGMQLFGALFVAGTAWAVIRLKPRADAAPVLPAAASVAAAGLLGAYLPFALSGAYKPQLFGVMSRVNGSGALVGGLILAAALEAIAAAGRPRITRALQAALFASILGGFTWTDWFTARLWSESWVLEQSILAKAAARLEKIPSAKVVMLNNIPGNRNGTEVFSEDWGFSSGLRITTGRKDLTGLVARRCMRSEARGIASYCTNPPVVTPYEGLLIYDAAEDVMKRAAPPSISTSK